MRRTTKTQRSDKATEKEKTRHWSAAALYDFLQVTAPERADFEIAAHLAGCPQCARVARQLAQAHAAVEDWSAETRRRAKVRRSRRKTDSSP